MKTKNKISLLAIRFVGKNKAPKEKQSWLKQGAKGGGLMIINLG
jgi:hypothetical protein